MMHIQPDATPDIHIQIILLPLNPLRLLDLSIKLIQKIVLFNLQATNLPLQPANLLQIFFTEALDFMVKFLGPLLIKKCQICMVLLCLCYVLILFP